MTPISVMKLMPETKEQVESFASHVKNEILEGKIDFKELLFQKAFIEKTLSAIFEDPEIKKLIEGEIEKYGKEGVGFRDVKFELMSRRSYDYSKTNDAEYLAIDAAAKKASEKLKERQKFLQTLTKPIEILNSDTGEIEMIYPAAQSVTTYVKSTIKK